MFRPRIIPCLLIRDGGLVKTIKFGKSTYIGDALNAVRLFNDLEADELIFLDIDASCEDRVIPLALVKKISEEAYMPFSVGGGIKRLDDAKRLIAAGAEKIVINTAAAQNSELVQDIANIFGSQSVVVSIDAKKVFFGRYRVAIFGGKKLLNIDPGEHAANMEKCGAGEILINSVDLDGVMAGYDIELIRKVEEKITVPLIALGGAGNYKQLSQAVKEGGASAAAAGSLFVFFGGRKGVLINYPSQKEKTEIFYHI